METLVIELTNSKAYKLLQDMEELNLIKVIKKKVKISDLKGKLTSSMSNEEIDAQLKELRGEWQRNF
ncbi:hypothetical protein [uncultured Mucilaginibacter sp.]|uniref:hypothetical protein n=1 Tax=uncultured Mucilaginibacter sp. TaxID=797541 RepID=UPI0025D71419|nr:hypothetical protein [uncultured Mucilaginibacter sp.]